MFECPNSKTLCRKLKVGGVKILTMVQVFFLLIFNRVDDEVRGPRERRCVCVGEREGVRAREDEQ